MRKKEIVKELTKMKLILSSLKFIWDNKIPRMQKDIDSLKEDLSKMKREFECSETGHDYEFSHKDWVIQEGNKVHGRYWYKCIRCEKGINYIWEELTLKEQNALKTLGLAEKK